ncbi:MAG: IS30 family transposase [Patescibacteria group bacterium]
MSYSHLTSNQRNELSALLRAKLKQKETAKILGKHRTTIYRELKRNGTDNQTGYDAKAAKCKTKDRRILANQRFKKIENSQWLEEYIVKKLKLYWSPEQLAGRLKKRKGKTIIGKDSIYKFIYQKRMDLVKYLRCQKGKYRRRYGTRIREKQREEAKKTRIDQRPQIIGSRQRIGDWEGDTIIGQEKTKAILTHVERKSGLLLADKLNGVKAEETRQATVKRFAKIPKDKRRSTTYDNGSEFADYELIARYTKMEIYFAYPYHSWERGTNENANGLLRQFFPKKTFFASITPRQISRAVKLINNRPRKRLDYLTPNEVFNECCTLD